MVASAKNAKFFRIANKQNQRKSMKTDGQRLTIIANDCNILGNAIQSALTSTADIAVIRSLKPEELFYTRFTADDVLVVRLEDCLTLDNNEQLATIIGDQVSLGIYSALERQPSASPASAFKELIGWPCSVAELAAKLKRLFLRVAHEHQIKNKMLLKANVVGRSDAFKNVLENTNKYSKCDAPVLITGETGTGKEIIARAIHYLASHDQPFVAVNCGAIPDSLIENELFGHVRGAYTDARQSQTGLIEQAEGGTLFLDEMEALSAKGQIALLRFLQDYEYRPLGSQKMKQASLRLIAATNETLEKLVEQGSFRKDLFYRLNILALHLPPLRSRGDDIILLAEHFLAKYRQKYRQLDRYLSPATLEWMRRYEWPGNVRELENLIHREFLLADSACISVPAIEDCSRECRRDDDDHRDDDLYRRSFQDAKSVVVEEFERNYLKHVLKKSSGNISEAARLAGKERRTFAKLMGKHGLNRGFPD